MKHEDSGFLAALMVVSLVLSACGSIAQTLPAATTTTTPPASTPSPLALAADDETADDETVDDKPSADKPADDETAATTASTAPSTTGVVAVEGAELDLEPEPGTPPTVTLSSADLPGRTDEGRLVDGVPVLSEECIMTSDGRLQAVAEILNAEDRQRDLVVEFAVSDPDGLRVSDGFDVVTDVEAGQRFLARDSFRDLAGFTTADGWSCLVISIAVA